MASPTMSVAMALQYAEVGKTLLISTDPSGSLSEILSRPLGRKVHTVAPNLDTVELTRKLYFKVKKVFNKVDGVL